MDLYCKLSLCTLPRSSLCLLTQKHNILCFCPFNLKGEVRKKVTWQMPTTRVTICQSDVAMEKNGADSGSPSKTFVSHTRLGQKKWCQVCITVWSSQKFLKHKLFSCPVWCMLYDGPNTEHVACRMQLPRHTTRFFQGHLEWNCYVHHQKKYQKTLFSIGVGL